MTGSNNIWRMLLDSRMDDIDISSRTGSRIKEVSPCSEYTRYTVEGVLKDPYSDLSVIMDVPSMGYLFSHSGMKKPKWSDALGYGMAMIGDETRVHVHKNGKFVIRRAMDREDAERCYGLISSIIWPALYSTSSDQFNWSLLRKAASGSLKQDEIEHPMLSWPDLDPAPDILPRYLKELQGIAGEVDTDLRGIIQSSDLTGDDGILDLRDRLKLEADRIDASLVELSSSKMSDTCRMRSGLTYHLWEHMAADHMENLITRALQGGMDDKHVLEQLQESLHENAGDIRKTIEEIPAGSRIDILGVHLLLQPVKV